MPTEPPHRHNGGPLSDVDARKLWDHIRAMEVLDEQAAEITADKKARKELAKADGFDNNIMAAILKRRKLGEGETRTADTLVRIYEEALQDQGALPLERSRQPATQPRSTVDEIAEKLHGQSAPPMPEKGAGVVEAARKLDETCRRDGMTATVTTGDGEVIARFGAGSMFDPPGPNDPF